MSGGVVVLINKAIKAMKNTLQVTADTFTKILAGIIVSGVTFEAVELPNGYIEITFTGGY